MSDRIGYFFVGLVMILIGAAEIRRIWLYMRHKKIILHQSYLDEIERIKEKQGEPSKVEYVKELHEKWWKHQGRISTFVAISATASGLAVIYLVLTISCLSC